jgi:hypothetical protein
MRLAAVAGRADLGEQLRQARAGALARHFDEAELRDLEDVAPHLVLLERGIEGVHDALLIRRVHHVDEIDDDDATDVAEAELIDDFPGGFEIGLEDGFLVVVLADVAAG